MPEMVTFIDIQRGDIVQRQIGSELREVIEISIFTKNRVKMVLLKHLDDKPRWFQDEATAEIVLVRRPSQKGK